MPAEHYRPDGKLAQGYYCGTCGQSCSMMGHNSCEPNPKLVQELKKANPANGQKPHFKLKA